MPHNKVGVANTSNSATTKTQREEKNKHSNKDRFLNLLARLHTTMQFKSLL